MGTSNERLLSELNVKDDLSFKLGDTLDVKASIGMVVITFLGTQTAYLLDKHVTGASHYIQAGSVLALLLATVASIAELWPRDYLMIEPEESTASRIAELEAHYAEYDQSPADAVIDELTKNEIEWTRQRISVNQKNNGAKGKFLVLAYQSTAVAFILNAITLLVVWVNHPF